jgi:RIO kinase 1
MPRYRYTEEDDTFDEFDQPERRRKAKPSTKTSQPKASYENNPAVQRWIARQAEDNQSDDLEFNPTFLASRRDGFWVRSSLSVFYQQELISDVLNQASSGKEATVYSCVAAPRTGYEILAAKVYRPRIFRNLSNDAIYRTARRPLDEDGRGTRRAVKAGLGNSTRARTVQISAWIHHEFQTQQVLYAAGAQVPNAIALAGNAILMEFIGQDGVPAPRLRDARIPHAQAKTLFEQLVADVQLWLNHHRVHGDLSEYNILYDHKRLVTIDFAQAVDPRLGDTAFDLLERDLDRICAYFAHYDVRADPRRLAREMWAQYLMG